MSTTTAPAAPVIIGKTTLRGTAHYPTAKGKWFEYTVVGHGDFPLDMLRYDASWPNSSESVTAIAQPYARPLTRRVHLSTRRHITLDRWQSFGWRVESITVRAD